MEEDFYIRLIYKRLSKEITSEEEKQLNDWVDQSSQNLVTLKSVEKAWSLTANVEPDLSVDLDEEFSFLETKMNEPKLTTSSARESAGNRRFFLSNAWKVAAGLLLVIASYFLLDSLLFKSDTNTNFATIRTDNSTKTIDLPDGSKVVMNLNSELKYPTAFSENERRVFLTGEAFFDIKRNERKKFVVETEKEEVTVLGTSFNVKALKGAGEAIVYVASGKVQMKGKDGKGQIILTKNEKGTYNRVEKNIQKDKQSTSNELFWKTGILEFDETPLVEVLEYLEQEYKVQFLIDDAQINQCPFSSTFKQEKLEDILQVIKEVLEVEIESINNKMYRVKGGICQ